MDYSSKLNPFMIIAQSESAIKNITQCNGELQQLKNSVQSFIDDSYIKSDAFDMLKEYASEIPGLIDRIIECNVTEIAEYKTLAASVGDEILIGSIIITNKNRYYKLWWTEKEKADMYRCRAKSATNPTMRSVLQSMADCCEEVAEQYHSLFVYWRTKEEKYDQIERITSNLFSQSKTIISKNEVCLKERIRIGGYYVIYKENVYDFNRNITLELDEWSYSASYSYIGKDGDEITNVWNISDADFTDWRSLTEDEISIICNDYNPELCRDGYDKAISEVAKDEKLNPKILLATLKQESGGRKSTRNAYGLSKKGIGDGDAITQTTEAAEVYMTYFREAVLLEQSGSMPTLIINRDNNLGEIRNFKGENAGEWIASNPNYVEYMKNGVSITPVNAAMYAKLKYTPWTDFPPNGAHQLSDWHKIIMEYYSYVNVSEE